MVPKLVVLVSDTVVAVPVRFVTCGLEASLSVNTTLPVRGPLAVGVKLRLTVHCAPAAIVDGQLFDCEKSPVVVTPDIVMDLVA